MNVQDRPKMVRRDFLRGALAMGVMIPAGAVLASCAAPSGSGSGQKKSGSTSGATSAKNPFGIKKDSSYEVVMFNGGDGYAYVTYAVKEVDQKWGTTSKVTPQTNIAQSLQPRFVGGTPPDLVNDAGANQMPLATIASQLETLDDIFDAETYEGKKISDVTYPGIREPGLVDDRFVALNYTYTVYGIWYSASLFRENGWTPPKTYDEAIELGAKAKAKKKYLFTFGKEAANYYQTMAVDSAIKQGGLEVMDALQNLHPKAWSQKPIQQVLAKLEEIVKRGYFIPGGAGTQFTAAQAKWSQDEQALLYPSGGWIETEMKKATKSGFEMTGAPEPTIDSSTKLPFASLRAGAGQPFVVPKQGKNPAAGKEVLRAMISKKAATNFVKSSLRPCIVKDLVPADGFGSTSLVSQVKMLDAAGKNIFNPTFATLYGLNTEGLVVWNAFLSGQTDAKGLASTLQKHMDQAAAKKK